MGHPDRGGDPEKFKQINEAYSIIGDNKKRSDYDYEPQGRANYTFTSRDFGEFENFFKDIFGSSVS